jgi:alpha-mannosidase
VAVENNFALETPWRKRFVVRVKIPPCGWHVLTAGLDSSVGRAKAREKAREKTDLSADDGGIRNSHWEIRASANTRAIVFARKKAGARDVVLRVLSVDDPWGSWGGHDGEAGANHVNETKAVWTIGSCEVIERGPERAALWVRLANGASWLELTAHLYRDDKAAVVRARAFWAEKSARLKLEFSTGGTAEFEVPGGSIRREPCGDVPGGRWVCLGAGRGSLVFASDVLYCFDATAETFGATVARSAPYASMQGAKPGVDSWRPHMDLGEHLFQFALADGAVGADALARRLEAPPVALLTSAHDGALARTGGVLRAGGGVRVLAFARAETHNGWLLRVQGGGAKVADATVEFFGSRIPLGRIARDQIRSFVLQQDGGRWKCIPVSSAEEPLHEKQSP